MITKCLLYEHFQLTEISFYFFINVKRKNYVSISWSKSKRNWKADMTKFITTRTLSVSVNMFLKNVVDWSLNYLCESLYLISWLQSCWVKVMAIFFCYVDFNYLESETISGKRWRPNRQNRLSKWLSVRKWDLVLKIRKRMVSVRWWNFITVFEWVSSDLPFSRSSRHKV